MCYPLPDATAGPLLALLLLAASARAQPALTGDLAQISTGEGVLRRVHGSVADGRDDLVTNEMTGNGAGGTPVDVGNLIVLGGALLGSTPALPATPAWALALLTALLLLAARPQARRWTLSGGRWPRARRSDDACRPAHRRILRKGA